MNQKARELMIELFNSGIECKLVSSSTSSYIDVQGHMVRVSDHGGHSKFKGTQIRKDHGYKKTKYGMIFGYNEIGMAVKYLKSLNTLTN
ncbi:hypothetical protein [Aeromonas phage AS-yj]|uniref:Uncharacterized protein n=1 Tax=Aeromonas phage AS-yj TaxID=2026115 RepID=A0A291LE42_9CAUD|nr:hypothetical protein [Aeromonas phage AS-yj]